MPARTNNQMVYPKEVAVRANAYLDAHLSKWAASCFLQEIGVESDELPDCAVLSVALHPPTERAALADLTAARAWVAEWHAFDEVDAVVWEKRNWSRIGAQEVPVKVILCGADSIALHAGKAPVWKRARKRIEQVAELWKEQWRDAPLCERFLLSEFGFIGEDTSDVNKQLARAFKHGLALSSDDWRLLLEVVEWLLYHPNISNYYVRQLPIKGVHSKWVESHKRAISSFLCAFAGSGELEFKQRPKLLRIRLLDESLSACGLTYFEALPSEVLFAKPPAFVLVCENLANVLALPHFEGGVAAFGGGYGVSLISELPAIRDGVRVLYWGDIDTNGFAILNELRAHLPNTESVMMDEETLLRHRDLCVIEPKANLGEFSNLAPHEESTLASLHTREGFLRLEQERIEWTYAMDAIRRLLGIKQQF